MCGPYLQSLRRIFFFNGFLFLPNRASGKLICALTPALRRVRSFVELQQSPSSRWRHQSSFKTALLERVRLPLDVTDATCTSGGHVDHFGRHRGACPQSRRLRTRAVGPERTLARVCREAGAVGRTNMKLRDTNITCSASNEREVEVVASGLPYGARGSPCPEGRSARHWQLPVDCCFCHAAVGDLVHCMSECPWFEDLQTEWCRRCGIPVQAASVWCRHSWIIDTTSLLNSPGTLRAHVRFVGAVCRRVSERVP